jgi:SAM-dependent methyltransferase
MPTNYFDEKVASTYDSASAEMSGPAVVGPAVDFLAGLAGDGAALELGIGTGRIGLPLHQRGVPVHGIDLSPAMVARLQEKPGAQDIGITIGDFATVDVPGTFNLAYLVFNTIMNLVSQDAQVRCFGNVARHLRPGGCFVVEVMVPELQWLPPGEKYRPFRVSPEKLGFDEYDVVNQGLISHHFSVVDGHLDVFSVPFRYVWPAELDLMALLAGMRPRERWANWRRDAFTSESKSHISVWEKVS